MASNGAKPNGHTKLKADVLLRYYFQMGTARSLTRMAKELTELGMKIGRNTLGRYSSTFDWPAQVAQLEAQVQTVALDGAVDDIVTMNRRQATYGQGMQLVAGQALTALRARPGPMSAGDIATLMERGSKMERLARGQATDRKEVAVHLVNHFIMQVMGLFLDVNKMEDAQEREAAFALGADGLVTSAMAGVEVTTE